MKPWLTKPELFSEQVSPKGISISLLWVWVSTQPGEKREKAWIKIWSNRTGAHWPPGGVCYKHSNNQDIHPQRLLRSWHQIKYLWQVSGLPVFFAKDMCSKFYDWVSWHKQKKWKEANPTEARDCWENFSGDVIFVMKSWLAGVGQ